MNANLMFIYSDKATQFCEIHQLFVLCTVSQIIGGDFATFCGLLRIYELYNHLELLDEPRRKRARSGFIL